MNATENEPVPEGAKEVVELFARRAEALRFPDMDVDVLTAAAEAVASARERVAELAEQLEASRDRARAEEEMLLSACRRAIAYARIYGETDASLAEAVAALRLERESMRPKPARAGRKRKRAPAEQPASPTASPTEGLPEAHPGDPALE